MTVSHTVPANVAPRSLPWLELAVLAAAIAWWIVDGAGPARAIVGGAVLAGVVAAARALLPREPIAGVIAAIVIAIAPAFRAAVARDAAGLLCAAAAIGALIAIGARRGGDRRRAIAIGAAAAAIAALAITGAVGALPPLVPGLSAVIAGAGNGTAAIVVAAGLLGAGFGALTGLPGARALIAAIAGLAIVGLVAPLFAVLAAGVAIVPAAIVRAVAADARGVRRHLITLAAGLPLIAGAAITAAPDADVAAPAATRAP